MGSRSGSSCTAVASRRIAADAGGFDRRVASRALSSGRPVSTSAIPTRTVGAGRDAWALHAEPASAGSTHFADPQPAYWAQAIDRSTERFLPSRSCS